jgi:hypothetical protein
LSGVDMSTVMEVALHMFLKNPDSNAMRLAFESRKQRKRS